MIKSQKGMISMFDGLKEELVEFVTKVAENFAEFFMLILFFIAAGLIFVLPIACIFVIISGLFWIWKVLICVGAFVIWMFCKTAVSG